MSIKDQWTSGADYDQWMGRWSRLLAHEFLKWLDVPPGLRWIDVCCGSGVITESIVERNAPAGVVGIDVSVEQINYARQHRVVS
jgi:ubiquinone/menaquinone biosynthesis C-methylase UbiE